MLRVNLQLFGGRGGSSGGPSGSTSRNINANMQNYHKEQMKALESSAYEDGTYDISSLTQVSYDRGYQVTFSQIGDNYSDEEYAQKVNEFLKISSDGKTLAGKFESTPEISFHTNSKAIAKRLAQKYNQISIWDWKNSQEIKTGGTGRR